MGKKDCVIPPEGGERGGARPPRPTPPRSAGPARAAGGGGGGRGERQGAFDGIVYSEGEDALQTLGQPAKTPLLVAVHQNLGIAAGLETMSPPFEFGAQDAVVVDLAVEDGPDRPVLVAHRLVAGMQVDDGEAPVAEPAETVGGAPLPFPVRPPSADRRQHLPGDVSRNRCGILRTQSQITSNPAHTFTPLPSRRGVPRITR